MRRLFVLLATMAVALAPGTAFAQTPDDVDDFTLRISGDVVIGEGERVNSVVVIDGNLLVLGDITEFALVISGDAVVRGSVGEVLTVISGDVILESTAVVEDVNSISGDVIRAAGATVSGDIDERDNFRFLWWIAGLFSVLLWIGITIAVIVSGLLFAAFGGRQLGGASRAMTGDLVNTILGAVFLWVGVPIIAGIAAVTIVGLPLGVGVIIFLLPTFGFLGYLVAGTRLGMGMLGLIGHDPGERPFLAATVGLLLLQFLVLIPFLGLALGLLAGAWGGGALAFRIYRNAGGKGFDPDKQPAAGTAESSS